MSPDSLEPFRENLENRNRWDTIINGPICFLLLIGPILFAFYDWGGQDQFYITTFPEYAGKLVASAVEGFMVVVLLFTMYNRFVTHAYRDGKWREALISYADSQGLKTDALLAEHRRITGEDKFSMTKAMVAVIVITALGAFIAIVFFPMELMGRVLIWVPVLIALLFAIPTCIRYPRKHESDQIRFTEILADTFRPSGIEITPMPRVVKATKTWKHLLLLVVTLGIYAIIWLAIMVREMNRHLRYQHSYEDHLLMFLEGDRDAFKDALDEEGRVIRDRHMPKFMFITELLLIAICFTYMTRITGIVTDFNMGMAGNTIINNINIEVYYNYAMILLYLALLMIAMFALVGIASGRLQSWRRVVRSCIAFVIPILASMFIYNPGSYVHLFDLNPYVTLAVAYGIILMTVMSVSIRAYYTPKGREMPKVRKWFIYVFFGKLYDDEDDSILNKIKASLF